MVPNRTVYEVAPSGEKWTLKKTRGPGKDVNSSHFTKDSAVDAGRAIAKANQPSQLIIKKKDGTIETEHTYGDDPNPPRG